MNDLKECPNCQASLESGFLASTSLLSDSQIKVINEYHEPKSQGYCTKCGKKLFSKYKIEIDKEIEILNKAIRPLISSIPVISTHTPLNWDYEIGGMVTGQSTTGTGVITEFTSSLTDIVGAQSGRHNKKLKAGEDKCFAQLRKQALDWGGNAVIATDIDYAEVGGIKGMLMICMAGTAINLKNTEILGSKRHSDLSKLIELNSRLRYFFNITKGLS